MRTSSDFFIPQIGHDGGNQHRDHHQYHQQPEGNLLGKPEAGQNDEKACGKHHPAGQAMGAVPDVGIGEGPRRFDPHKKVAFELGHHIAQEKKHDPDQDLDDDSHGDMPGEEAFRSNNQVDDQQKDHHEHAKIVVVFAEFGVIFLSGVNFGQEYQQSGHKQGKGAKEEKGALSIISDIALNIPMHRDLIR